MARNIEFIPEEKVTKAMNVFWNKGYTGASLSDLTEAMKLNKSSLYNSFKDKHSLFIASLKAYGKIVENDYASALNKKDTPLEKIDSIIDKIAMVSIERENSCLGIKTTFEVAAQDKEAHAVIKAGNSKTIGLIKSLIIEAQTLGQIRKERDAETMSHFIFNSFPGFRQSYIIYGNKKLVKGLANELKGFLRQ
ncbi:TetR/AcrR family transcriptional regulator [Parapedobacter koreensis]|nr:TetR/AcrR family transcriptional regulator [Parapedobacter koreensis]